MYLIVMKLILSSQAMQVQSQRYDVPVLPIAEQDHQKTYATLLNVFLEIHRIVCRKEIFLHIFNRG
jgi:hypothetical protein